MHDLHLQTYLERDVRTLRQVGDLTQYQSFLRVTFNCLWARA